MQRLPAPIVLALVALISAHSSLAQPPATSPAVGAVPAEYQFWLAVKESAYPEDYEEYLRKFPTGDFANVAAARLARLAKGGLAPLQPVPGAHPVQPPPPNQSPPPVAQRAMAGGPSADLAIAVVDDDTSGALAALRAGANPNCADCASGANPHQTPLMLAAQYGGRRSPDNAMVRLLLQYGAKPDLQDPAGLTALSYAAQSGRRGHEATRDTVLALLAAGARPGIAGPTGLTPIFWWAVAGLNPNDPFPGRDDAYRAFLAIAKAFSARGADLAQRDSENGATALHLAAQSCNPHTTLMMLALGLEAEAGDQRLRLPAELVDARMRAEGRSRQCVQTLEVLRNPAVIGRWRLMAIQVPPLGASAFVPGGLTR